MRVFRWICMWVCICGYVEECRGESCSKHVCPYMYSCMCSHTLSSRVPCGHAHTNAHTHIHVHKYIKVHTHTHTNAYTCYTHILHKNYTHTQTIHTCYTHIRRVVSKPWSPCLCNSQHNTIPYPHCSNTVCVNGGV